MAIVLFDPAWIVARLKTEVTALKLVGGTADLASAKESLKQKPAAFVLPNSEHASENKTGTLVVSQENNVRFAVVIAVQNLRDARGENAQADLRTIRMAIATALYGWQPDSEFNPIQYGGGKLLQITDQVVWHQDEYLTAHLLRSV